MLVGGGEEEEVEAVFEEGKELWSSPLMFHKSPFDDYEDLYADIDHPPSSSSSSSSATASTASSSVFRFPSTAGLAVR
ncbi:hypothetical protein ACOMHN_061865 [Nucella lapillus]